jgi:DNA-binding Xre family transcriptional regulator
MNPIQMINPMEKLRIERQLNVLDIAHDAGVSSATVCAITLGKWKSINKKVLHKLATTYGIDPIQFYLDYAAWYQQKKDTATEK